MLRALRDRVRNLPDRKNGQTLEAIRRRRGFELSPDEICGAGVLWNAN
jgi:hypothetical protein